MLTLNRERVEAGLLGLLDPRCGTDLEETLNKEGTHGRQLSNCQGFDLQISVRLVRILDRTGPCGGSTLSLHLRKLAKCAPSSAKREGSR
jgi:hypothetical protein